MIPYSNEEWNKRILIYGTVFVFTRWKDGKLEHFLLDKEEVTLKELQNDKQEL